MSKTVIDPTIPIRAKARTYPGVVEGTSCNQTSFKIGKKAFLFIGMQGGRYKAMFKLKASRSDAVALAEKHPDNYGVGSNIWITTRFTAEEPIPDETWQKWLDESYELSL